MTDLLIILLSTILIPLIVGLWTVSLSTILPSTPEDNHSNKAVTCENRTPYRITDHVEGLTETVSPKQAVLALLDTFLAAPMEEPVELPVESLVVTYLEGLFTAVSLLSVIKVMNTLYIRVKLPLYSDYEQHSTTDHSVFLLHVPASGH